MITNERQYRITKNWLKRFEQAKAGVAQRADDLHPIARQALVDQYMSEVKELRAQLAAYEALRRGEVHILELDSLEELPDALIQARAATGLSQASLAGRMGIKKQQVQRWETNRYAGVGVDRLQAVADALGVQIREQVMLPAASPSETPEPVAAPSPEEFGDATSFAGILKRVGLTLNELAARVCLPASVVLKLQRGRIDPPTVPQQLLDALGQELRLAGDDARRLIAVRSPASRLTHARATAQQDIEVAGTRSIGRVDLMERELVSFREALERAPDLTYEHRQAWLEATREEG